MYIHTEDVSDVAYVSHRVRVKVKAIGSLETKDAPVDEVGSVPITCVLQSVRCTWGMVAMIQDV